MKITILCNNSVKTFWKCIGEHGFSAFIETDDGNYLFDTGYGIGVIENALIMNKDLKSVKAIILSHGHSDHCGGIEKVLKSIGSKKPVYTHSSAFSDRYATGYSEKTVFVGIPFRREYLESLGAEFRMIENFTRLSDNVYVTGIVARTNNFELPEKKLLVKSGKNGEMETDPVLDDFSLVIKSSKGFILILGCAHAGTANIMDYVARKLNIDRFYAVIGGTHLAEADNVRMEKTMEAFARYDVQKIGTCHCTGPEKEAMLKERFRDKFFFAHAGCEFEF